MTEISFKLDPNPRPRRKTLDIRELVHYWNR